MDWVPKIPSGGSCHRRTTTYPLLREIRRDRSGRSHSQTCHLPDVAYTRSIPGGAPLGRNFSLWSSRASRLLASSTCTRTEFTFNFRFLDLIRFCDNNVNSERCTSASNAEEVSEVVVFAPLRATCVRALRTMRIVRPNVEDNSCPNNSQSF